MGQASKTCCYGEWSMRGSIVNRDASPAPGSESGSIGAQIAEIARIDLDLDLDLDFDLSQSREADQANAHGSRSKVG